MATNKNQGVEAALILDADAVIYGLGDLGLGRIRNLEDLHIELVVTELETEYAVSVSHRLAVGNILGSIRGTYNTFLEHSPNAFSENQVLLKTITDLEQIRKNLTDNQFEIYDIGGYVRKNRGDQDVVERIHEILRNYPNIDCFCLMANDSDFCSVITTLNKAGKKTIVIPITWKSASSELTKLAWKHICYQDLRKKAIPNFVQPEADRDKAKNFGYADYKPDSAQSKADSISSDRDKAKNFGYADYKPDSAQADSISSDVKKLRDKYFLLIVGYCKRMTDAKKLITGSVLTQGVQGIDPDFDYRRAGYDKLIDMLNDMAEKGYIIVYKPLQGDMTIQLAPGAIEKKPLPQEAQEAFTPPTIINLPSDPDPAVPQQEKTTSEQTTSSKSKPTLVSKDLSDLSNIPVQLPKDKSSPGPSKADSTLSSSGASEKNSSLSASPDCDADQMRNFLKQHKKFHKMVVGKSRPVNFEAAAKYWPIILRECENVFRAEYTVKELQDAVSFKIFPTLKHEVFTSFDCKLFVGAIVRILFSQRAFIVKPNPKKRTREDKEENYVLIEFARNPSDLEEFWITGCIDILQEKWENKSIPPRELSLLLYGNVDEENVQKCTNYLKLRA